MTDTPTLIRNYASWILTECVGEDETPTALLTAVGDAQNSEEVEHLGRALLARHESLADASYRYGEKNYDPALKAIATALGWAA